MVAKISLQVHASSTNARWLFEGRSRKKPENPYALAKDTLRKYLEQLQTHIEFNLKWIRLFYMYGKVKILTNSVTIRIST